MSKLTVEQVMELAPVIPVLVVERVEDALPIAQALVKGGLPALEVTLRTPAALDVIREMSQVEGAVVGAGTVLNAAQLDAAMKAGARFIVSPGLTEPLGKAAIAADVVEASIWLTRSVWLCRLTSVSSMSFNRLVCTPRPDTSRPPPVVCAAILSISSM